MTQYGGSQSYIWAPDRSLGHGTSGNIYRGWQKKTAGRCAVKVFKATAPKHALKEIEVIKGLRHPHIVQVLGIETNTRTKETILIMEYCEGGSLHSKLREPTFYFGLPEDDLLRFIQQISAALEYLYQNQVIHRDVKPGNILCSYGPHGWTDYKLSDFGTAAFLRNREEDFSSLQGTEEYMHPDMYQDLVNRHKSRSRYSSKADLYSMGVTIFQAATGLLPFIVPGGRRDKLSRVALVTEKPSNRISGTVGASGQTSWQSTLPETCRISVCLKAILEQILMGVLEQDPTKAWSFDQYFRELDELRSCVVIHVFVTMTCVHHRVYLQPRQRLVHLQDELAKLTDVPVNEQMLMYPDCHLQEVVTQNQCLKDYRVTSEKEPIIFLSKSQMVEYDSIYIPAFPNVPTLPEHSELDEDYSIGRELCAIVHYAYRIVLLMELSYTLLEKAMLVYGFPASLNIRYRLQLANQMDVLWSETRTKLHQGFVFCHVIPQMAGKSSTLATMSSTFFEKESNPEVQKERLLGKELPGLKKGDVKDPKSNLPMGAQFHKMTIGDIVKPAAEHFAQKDLVVKDQKFKEIPFLDEASAMQPSMMALELEFRQLEHHNQIDLHKHHLGGDLSQLATVLWSGSASRSATGLSWSCQAASFVKNAESRQDEIKRNHQKKSLDRNERQIHTVERYRLRKSVGEAIAFFNDTCVSGLKKHHNRYTAMIKDFNIDSDRMRDIEEQIMLREERRQELSAKFDKAMHEILMPFNSGYLSLVPPTSTKDMLNKKHLKELALQESAHWSNSTKTSNVRPTKIVKPWGIASYQSAAATSAVGLTATTAATTTDSNKFSDVD